MQYLVSKEHFVFPSGILIPSLPPSLAEFLPSYFPSEVGVGGLFLLWGNWLVSLRSAVPSLVFSDTMIDSCLLPYLLSFLQRPQLEKVRREVEEGGSRVSGGWLSLEGIFRGFLLAPYHRAAAMGTWPNLFTLALGALSLFTPYTSPH